VNAPRPSRILLVDDDRAFRISTAELLRQDGHEVVTAAGAGEAGEHLAADRVDLILLDVRMPRIFDPFFTTKGEVHGVGLGLFVAEGIIRAHGGALTARNRPEGAGAVFRVELPSTSPADAESDEQVSQEGGSA